MCGSSTTKCIAPCKKPVVRRCLGLAREKVEGLLADGDVVTITTLRACFGALRHTFEFELTRAPAKLNDKSNATSKR